MNNHFKEKIIDLAEKIDIDLKENEVQKYYDYMNLLLEWNKKINLTAITEVDDVILKHFIDSMTVIKYVKNSEKIIDVGTGAGFPGVPLAIHKHDCEITLLDSLNKRILFLQDIIERLGLKNVKTIHSRAEDFGQDKNYREKYDVSISRAVANLTVLVEYLLPLIKIGGKCICMKGANVEDEIENARFAIKELGGKIINVDKLTLPNSDMERNIIIIEKIGKTPAKYPRKAGVPSKSPLL